MNANDTLSHHNCTDDYHKYNFGLIITDGALALAEKFECFWFLDIIASYQPKLQQEEFQVWRLKRDDNSSEANVTCDNGNGKILRKQRIPFTDFSANEATIWVESGVALLPSEH